ncbi:MAG: hypothetical protein SVM80_07675 [Halobacteriota archaeon]|nr:hypothetical protein [Halobacteriota archaeon]
MSSAASRIAKLSQLEYERNRLLKRIEPLVESGKGEDAIKQIEEAKRLTKELEEERIKVEKLQEEETMKSAAEKEASEAVVEESEESAGNAENDKAIEQEDMEWAKGKISELMAERDEYLEKIEMLIKEKEAEKAAVKVEAAANLSEELKSRTTELSGHINTAKKLTEDLSTERARLGEIRAKEESKIEKVAVKLPKLDRAVLNAISLGYVSPKKLSKKLNIDKEAVKEKIDELIRNDYVKDPSDPIADLLNILRLSIIISFIEVLTTRKLIHTLVLTSKGYDNIDEETVAKISERIEHREEIVERVLGWVLGTVISIIRPVVNYVVAILSLLQLGISVVKELPSIIVWGLKLWSSGAFSSK